MIADRVKIVDRFAEVDLIFVKWGALIGAIAFGEAGCFGAANAARLLGYCARLLDLYAACAAESLGVDVRAEGAAGLLGAGCCDAAG
jgi:hypothetical protein